MNRWIIEYHLHRFWLWMTRNKSTRLFLLTNAGRDDYHTSVTATVVSSPEEPAYD